MVSFCHVTTIKIHHELECYLHLSYHEYVNYILKAHRTGDNRVVNHLLPHMKASTAGEW